MGVSGAAKAMFVLSYQPIMRISFSQVRCTALTVNVERVKNLMYFCKLHNHVTVHQKTGITDITRERELKEGYSPTSRFEEKCQMNMTSRTGYGSFTGG